MRNFAKKAISLLCVLSMLFSMVVTSSAQATITTVSVESQTVDQGTGSETVEVPIEVSNNTGILGMTVSVTFDEGLTLVNAVKGEALSSLTFTKSKEFTDVPYNLVWDGQDSAETSNGVIAILTFEVPKGTAKDYSVNIVTSGVFDGDVLPFEPVAVGGKISVVGGQENPSSETTVKIISQTVTQGTGTETVEVPIEVSNNTGILGMTVSVTFDEDLALVNAVKGEALSSLTFTKSKEFTDVPYNLVWDGQDSAETSNGVIAILTFEVPKGTAKDYSVNIVTSGVFDGDVQPFEPVAVSGIISVTSGQSHKHSFGSWTKVDDEKHSRSCECGETETESHNTDGVVAHKDATCTEDGVVGGNYCTRCNNGKTATEAKIDKLGHNSDGVVAHKDATCTEDGVVGGTYCTRCNEGKTEAEATIDKLGHNTDGVVAHKDATCTENGVVGGTYCTRCNEGKTEAEATIDKLGHNTDGVVAHKDATCTEDGVVGGNYCTRCNNGKADAEATIDKLGHNTDGVVAHKDATCTEDGVVGGNYCTRCNNGKAEAEEVIIAPGHNTDGFVAHKDATCTEEGVVGGNYCTVCNNGKTEAEATIDKLGHNTDGVVAHKDATCTEDGVVGGNYCTRCNNGKADAEEVIIAPGHNTDGVVAHKDATCTEDGVVGGNYCTRCNNGKTEAEATIDKLGHNTDGVVAHKDATCTEDGVVGGTYCTRCNEGKAAAEEVIIAPGHNTDGVVAHKDATCTEDGVVGGNYCTRCYNGKADAEATIDKLGHNTDGVVVHKEATCTEDGVVGGTYCTRCNNGKAEAEATIDMLGHNTDGVVAHKDATCTEDGVVGGTYCTRCNNGKADAEATIDMLGHNTDGVVAHKDATCTEDGVVGGNYCTRCNNGKADAETTIDMLGHNFIGDYVEAASGHYRKCINANCTEKGLDGVKDKTEAHNYTNDDDESCNDCGFTRVLTYTVTLVANDGTVGTSLTSYNYGTTTTLPTDCTKTGFNFVGWYDNEGLSGEAVTSILATAKGNKTYYAKWTINQYTITFDTDGGSEIAPITQDYNSAVTTPENPTKSGYNFVKWVDCEGNEITVPTTMPAEDITLKAIWKRRSSGGGSSSTTTTTTKNDDGSKTTTTTNKVTGTVTETTTNPDGSSIKVETKKDGTITTTEKDKDGNTSTTVEKPDGTSTTTEKNKNGSEKVTEKSADGTTVTTEKDTDGTKTVTTENADGIKTTEETKKDGTKVTTETTADGETTVVIDLSKDKETEVTIPASNAGDITSVTVTDKDGKETLITDFEITDDGVKISVSGDCTAVINKAAKKEFADVHSVDHWAIADVDYVITKGLMSGVSETHFAPNDNLTRAMLATVLYRLDGEPSTNKSIPFADVDMGAYYGNAVSWAKQNGIVSGVTENSFAPDTNITREQIATILFRYAQYKEMNAVTLEENLHFTDSSEISDYAVSAMNWAVGTGLMKGKSATTINPKDNATRAEIAAILQRFIEANK